MIYKQYQYMNWSPKFYKDTRSTILTHRYVYQVHDFPNRGPGIRIRNTIFYNFFVYPIFNIIL